MSAAADTRSKLEQMEPEITAPPKPTLESVIQETQRHQAELQFQEDRFKFQQRRAQMYAISGLFGSTDKITLDQAIAQAMVRIDLGEGMGFSAAESMQGIDIIANRPAISSALRAARMQAAGFSWAIQFHREKTECAGCTLWLNYRGKPLLEMKRKDDGTPVLDEEGKPVMEQAHVSFRKSDAEWMKTTIWEDGQKKRVTLLAKWIHGGGATLEDMYFSKVIVRAQRRYASGVLSTSLLSTDEAMDLEVEPFVFAAPAEEKPQGKGNAGLKDALGIKEAKGAEIHDNLQANAAPTQQQQHDAVFGTGDWKTEEEMQKGMKALRDRCAKIGSPEVLEFDHLRQRLLPMSLEKGNEFRALIERHLASLKPPEDARTMQELHGKTQGEPESEMERARR